MCARAGHEMTSFFVLAGNNYFSFNGKDFNIQKLLDGLNLGFSCSAMRFSDRRTAGWAF